MSRVKNFVTGAGGILGGVVVIAILLLIAVAIGGVGGAIVAALYNFVFGASLSLVKFAALGSTVGLIAGGSAQ